MGTFTESVVEEAALAWIESIGWCIAHGPDIAPDMPAAERADYGEVLLAQRLHDALLPKLMTGQVRVSGGKELCARSKEN